jgi:ATP-binding cassette subfamily F protein 3
LLSLTNIGLRRGTKVLFEGASMQLHAGQRLGLIGANGCGKSSLFAMLLGQLEADQGELGLDSDDVIAHVRQESPHNDCSALDYVLDGDTELRNIQARIDACQAAGEHDSPELHELFERMEIIQGYAAEARAARLLSGLGFAADTYHNPVHSFSGGWRMRLNLAQALMCRSDILLLDDPTNHLDLPAILWLERQLRQFEGVLMVISHDRDFIDSTCTRIAHIEHQQLNLYTGNYSDFEKLRAEQLAQQQAMHERQQKDIKHLQSFVDRFRYKASKARQAQSRVKMMERMTLIAPAHVDSPFRFRFLEPEKQPQHLLKLDHARLGYGDVTVLQDINISISAGDRLGLLGVNGAGKSTLVKALAEGSTLLGGERMAGRDTRIGYFAQHQLEQLRPDESAYDHLQELMPNEREAELRKFLGRFGFSGERIFEPVAPFSGGEKARLVLALMIRQRPNLLLLDEPTNHLDLDMRQALSMALMEYSGALVVIAHDRHLLRSVCDELLIVHDGQAERFEESLDEYANWLRDREKPEPAQTGGQVGPASEDKISKKQLRQREAQRRQALKPLLDAVRKVEQHMARQRMQLEMLEKKLADEALYSDPERRDELAGLVREQGELKNSLSQLEWQWLEASEALEKAEQGGTA